VQLHDKSWASPEDIGNLVAALDDIFDLQNNICGCGIDHRFDAKEHVAKLFSTPGKLTEIEEADPATVIQPRPAN
jgi:hypothetical protein